MRASQGFFEHLPQPPLLRRAAAEGLGTFLLIFVVTTAALFTPGFGRGAAALARALAVGPALAALILALGPVSGGHFNPLITLGQWMRRERPTSCLLAYLAAQFIGGGLAAALAGLMFAASPTAAPTPVPEAISLGFEFIASLGLLILVFAAPNMRPAGVGPLAVGGWIAMTLASIPTAPAANPAISIGLLWLHPAPGSSLAHVGVQIVGLCAALGVTHLLYPASTAVTEIPPPQL